MATPEQLWGDYNEWHYLTGRAAYVQSRGLYLKRLKPTKERLQALQKMSDWCAEYQLDPRRYLYCLFSKRGWLASPGFHQLVPTKKKKRIREVLDYYENVPDIDRFTQYLYKELAKTRERRGDTVFNANRDLAFGTEAIKKRYLASGDVDRCYDEMIDRTFGFHPRSLVCARCPLAKKCEDTLRALTPSFDIVALRETADAGPARYGRE
jgi:hypothetical protein